MLVTSEDIEGFIGAYEDFKFTIDDLDHTSDDDLGTLPPYRFTISNRDKV